MRFETANGRESTRIKQSKYQMVSYRYGPKAQPFIQPGPFGAIRPRFSVRHDCKAPNGAAVSAREKWVNEIEITPEPFCKRTQAALMYKQQGGNRGTAGPSNAILKPQMSADHRR